MVTEESPTKVIDTSKPQRTRQRLLAKRLLHISELFALLAFVGAAYYTTYSLQRFDLSFSLEGFLSLGSRLYSMTYEEREPFVVRILTMWVYPSALFGGMSCAVTAEKRRRLRSLVALVPALFLGAAISARFGIAIAACCWISGYLATRLYANRGKYHPGRKTVLALALFSLALVGVFISFDLIRGFEYEDLIQSKSRISSFMLGYLSAFSEWLRSEHGGPLGFGVYSVAGPFDALGVKTREHGLYTDVISLQGGDYTNIYTAFRGLIQDFSLPGALVIIFLFGAVAGYAYSKSCVGSIRWIFPLAAYYLFFLWSPMVSPFNYNSVILAWVVGPFLVSNADLRRKGRVKGLIRAPIPTPPSLPRVPNLSERG